MCEAVYESTIGVITTAAHNVTACPRVRILLCSPLGGVFDVMPQNQRMRRIANTAVNVECYNALRASYRDRVIQGIFATLEKTGESK